MSDSPALPPELAFEPVVFARRRRDGWTPERQRGFILALSKIGMIVAAAWSVGMSRKSVYTLLERAGPESGFARAADTAMQMGRTNAWFTAVGRAIDGVEVPYFYGGIQRGTRRVYDNRLLIAAFRSVERLQAEGRRERKRALKRERKQKRKEEEA